MNLDLDEACEQTLTEINLGDVLEALGVDRDSPLGRGLAVSLRPSARKFARQILTFDHWVAEVGLHRAASRFISMYVNYLEIKGESFIPHHGPLLVLANHPGLSDALALFTALPRNDLRILAAERPFLDALPAVKGYLIQVSEDESARVGVIRQAIRHLRSGGVLLNFPAGRIEPDPAVLPGACGALDTWSESIGVFVRAVPQATILPIIVSGVLSSAALRHPITRLRKSPRDRERLAAMLWILMRLHRPGHWPVNVTVHVLPPLEAARLSSLHEVRAITQAVIAHIKAHFPFTNKSG
ncbi:lysophospholipid acyltransferase family protein [uncultured Thermanaerothrix sp.]|uniref:lysophospholipid acyltransferase family protein n=1 Tax=uncultured Thermanaerothrix sp. TaxID=1195149 RepID=UPI00260F182D|nr:lysophospholipid acyltransferase family protein [uncultured Thermanaerothrix sp.]